MRRARFLSSSVADLVAILDYVTQARGSVVTARSFVSKVRTRCDELAGHEMMVGRPRPEYGSDFRSIPHGSYIIFFRYSGNRFEVVRIVEGHRDLGSQFGATST